MKKLVEYLNGKRILAIAVFDDETNEKISAISKKDFCKVPMMIPDRIRMDTLPFHLSLFELSDKDIKNFKFINDVYFNNHIKIIAVEINESKKGGYSVYLRVEANEILHNRESLMEKLPINTPQFYDNWKGHITLGNFETKQEAQEAYNYCLNKFNPFLANIKSIQIQEIYPASLIKTIKIKV